MKSRTTILIIVGIFILAAVVVGYVLWSTKQTLKEAQTAADKAHTVIDDVQGIGSGLKKAWTDFKGVF